MYSCNPTGNLSQLRLQVGLHNSADARRAARVTRWRKTEGGGGDHPRRAGRELRVVAVLRTGCGGVAPVLATPGDTRRPRRAGAGLRVVAVLRTGCGARRRYLRHPQMPAAPPAAWPWRPGPGHNAVPGTILNRGETLFEVGDDVVDMLSADRQPDGVLADALVFEFRVRKLRVRG